MVWSPVKWGSPVLSCPAGLSVPGLVHGNRNALHRPIIVLHGLLEAQVRALKAGLGLQIGKLLLQVREIAEASALLLNLGRVPGELRALKRCGRRVVSRLFLQNGVIEGLYVGAETVFAVRSLFLVWVVVFVVRTCRSLIPPPVEVLMAIIS